MVQRDICWFVPIPPRYMLGGLQQPGLAAGSEEGEQVGQFLTRQLLV
mgnify:CR=1 FL=1